MDLEEASLQETSPEEVDVHSGVVTSPQEASHSAAASPLAAAIPSKEVIMEDGSHGNVEDGKENAINKVDRMGVRNRPNKISVTNKVDNKVAHDKVDLNKEDHNKQSLVNLTPPTYSLPSLPLLLIVTLRSLKSRDSISMLYLEEFLKTFLQDAKKE